MLKGWVFGLLIFFETVLGLSYGFLLQNIIPVEVCLFIAFLVPFFVIAISFKNQREVYVKMIETFVLSLLLMVVFIAVFFGGNQWRGEFIGEYDVIVEYVNHRGGGYADFTTPQGLYLNSVLIACLSSSVARSFQLRQLGRESRIAS